MTKHSPTASLAISRGTVVLGLAAPTSVTGGSVHVFDRDASGALSNGQELPATECATELGSSVALATIGTKDVLAVGQTFQCATDMHDAEARRGRVRTFERSEGAWVESSGLDWRYGEFGTSIAFVGSTLAVGAPTESLEGGLNGKLDGAVHLFNLQNGEWKESGRIVPTLDGFGSDDFGSALAGANDVLIVGARLTGGEMDEHGAVYQFEKTGSSWTNVLAHEGKAGARTYLGASVAISGDEILAGAPETTSERHTPEGPVFQTAAGAVRRLKRR